MVFCVAWNELRATVTRVTVKPGVKSGDPCSYMFESMPNVTVIDLSGLDITAVQGISSMFNFCPKLKTIYANKSTCSTDQIPFSLLYFKPVF